MFEKEVMSINRLTKFFGKQFAQPRSQGSVLPVPTFVYLRTVTGAKSDIFTCKLCAGHLVWLYAHYGKMHLPC